ncbi:MAG TPA: metallopeptidase family protein [Actinomycetota bacterium]|jgi:predicted Zn-dependent protease with MMP-like domain|nr:metallopeptidase family protein [Actinomycetota bacterium]
MGVIRGRFRTGDFGRRRFEQLAAEALDSLPAWITDKMENVEVIVEEWPPDDRPDVLGLYEGIPLTARGQSYAGVLPDRITLFRQNIQAHAADDDHLKRIVRHTVAHEIAHHFGISDDRLRQIDRY